MYCPTCGSQQQEERKFCTACGTNLGAVTAALSNNFAPAPVPVNDALAMAQSQYRREMASAIYKGAPGVGLLLAAIFIFAILPAGVSVWICFGLIIGGISCLGRGIGQYYLAQSELKAAELKAASTVYNANFAPSSAPSQIPAATTAPIPPPSVTEHTTRHLG